MTWHTNHFYFRPAEIEIPTWKRTYDTRKRWVRNPSIHLTVEDGWRACLELDDCLGTTEKIERGGRGFCNCEEDETLKDKFEPAKGCGYGDPWAMRELSREDLVALRDSINEAIEYLDKKEIYP